MKMSWIKRIDINARHIKTEDDFHDEIEGFADIDGYGRNLDALYDVLSESNDLIVIENADYLKKNLGKRGEMILRVISDAAENNDMLTVVLK